MTGQGMLRGQRERVVRRVIVAFVLTCLVLPVADARAVDVADDPRLVSMGPDAPGRTGASFSVSAVSYTGRYVAFLSNSSDLVADDGNICAWGSAPESCMDVYLKDLHTGALTQVSTSTDGTLADGNSLGGVAISALGRYVAFGTEAALLPNDTNREVNGRGSDIYMRDMEAATIARVSMRYDGSQTHGEIWGPSISADGARIAFISEDDRMVRGDTNGSYDVFVHDPRTRATTLVSRATSGEQANASSLDAAISPDGRYVVFSSRATNLAPGDRGRCEYPDNDETVPCSNVYLHDLDTGATTMIRRPQDDVADGGTGSVLPTVSDGARVIAFVSDHQLTGERGSYQNTYAYYRATGEMRLLTRPLDTREWAEKSWWGVQVPSVSHDGRRIAIGSHWTLTGGDTASSIDSTECYRFIEGIGSGGLRRARDCANDVYVYDEGTDAVRLGSVGLRGVGSMTFGEYGALSGDGRSLAFSADGNGVMEDPGRFVYGPRPRVYLRRLA